MTAAWIGVGVAMPALMSGVHSSSGTPSAANREGMVDMWGELSGCLDSASGRSNSTIRALATASPEGQGYRLPARCGRGPPRSFTTPIRRSVVSPR